MKITIDTKDDSHEDIRKVIALLSKMIESESSPNIFGESKEEASESAGANAFANMFGDEGTPVLEPSPPTEEDDDEEPDEGAQIMEY
ncbi:hypothetical protein KY332_05215 [Candidatus Woesearchaeota archaeon]|nr:hypothetical protein [Candidatus Woesearchaeota archaeon]